MCWTYLGAVDDVLEVVLQRDRAPHAFMYYDPRCFILTKDQVLKSHHKEREAVGIPPVPCVPLVPMASVAE